MVAKEAAMGKTAVTMRELQKMSAAAIKALPHAVPIKSGDETVGMLTPLKRPDPEQMKRVLRRIEEDYTALSPETQQWIQRYLDGREA
jgi:hypothetical protein